MNFNESEKNAYLALKHLLKSAKIKVTDTTLEKTVASHPDFPSMVSLSDVLNDLHVQNMGTRIGVRELSNIPLPAIGHFDNASGGFFITILRVSDENIEYLIDNKEYKEHLSQFIRKWGGIVLLIQTSEKSGEEKYIQKSFWETIELIRIPFIMTTAICVILSFWFLKNPLEVSLDLGVLFVKIIGTIISCLLIWYSLDANNSFLRKICQINDNSNCNSLLQSNGSRLFGVFSWSELGLFYFSGGLINILISKDSLNLLTSLNYLAVPYIFYSLYCTINILS